MDKRLVGIGVVVVGGLLAGGLWVLRTGDPDPAAREAVPEPKATRSAPLPVVDVVPPAAPLPPRSLEDLAVPLAGADGVVCRVEPEVEGGVARLELDGDPEEWLAAAAVHGHVLVLSSVPEDGAGILRIEGFAPLRIQWSGARDGAGACDPDPIELSAAEAAVVGQVRGAAGRAVTLTACGQPAVLGPDGGFYASASPDEPCIVEARRHLGVWEWADQVQVVPRVGADGVVTIDAPDFDGVIPIVIAEDGAVAECWGDDVPLPAGAHVVTVDGEAVPSDADGFHLATGGEPGTTAVLEVEADGERFEVTLQRQALTFEDWLVR